MFEIGTSLREARERRKLGYDQVEAETKIRAKYIRCLEDEDFDVLPSGTYVKGFLRTYADYLGLDGQLYVDEYNSRHGDTHPDDMLFRRRERPPAKSRRHESSSVVLIALAGIVAVAVLFFVAFTFGNNNNNQQINGNALPRVPTHFAPLRNSAIQTPPPAKHKAKQHHAAAHHTTPKTVSLTVTASGGDCWVLINRGTSSTPLYEQTLLSGQSTGPYTSPTGFTIANAGVPQNLRLTVNGKPYTLTGNYPWRVTATGVRSLAASTTGSTTSTTTGTTSTSTTTG
jgi:cytoskeletal protein RodZ